jgi:hypothetical protein
LKSGPTFKVGFAVVVEKAGKNFDKRPSIARCLEDGYSSNRFEERYK